MNTAPVPQESQIEQRLAALEQQMAGILRADAAQRDAPRKDWESTVGMFQNDPLFEEAMRLGREYRESQSLPEDCEGA